MRTIALRLTGTKSAKDALEELGEDTENVIVTQSKLRDVIKEATAVASNEFKGFDILDDNGNYKSTYEIMLGISKIYDEIAETDKKFGRNNLNLLLETVAGKVRANIAASIFQSPEVLEKAYKSSQEANGSALRENEKYLNSISGHLAQLTNAWQKMWANAANREVINFFIDLGKTIINLINAVGVLPTTLIAITTYLEVIRAGSGKGLITQFLSFLGNLAANQELINTNNTTGIALSAAKTVANKAEALSTEELAEAYMTLGEAEGTEQTAKKTGILTSKLQLLSKAKKGIVATFGEMGAAALSWGTLAVVVAASVYKAYKDYETNQYNMAKDATNNIQERAKTLEEQVESYKKLKAELDSGNLSEEETLSIKQQIFDIQKAISEEYGKSAKGVDLINGKLEEQVNLLNTIDSKQALKEYSSNIKGFEVAEKRFNKKDLYQLQVISNGDEFGQALQDQLAKAGFKLTLNTSGGANADVFTNAGIAAKTLEQARDNLEDLKKQYTDPYEVQVIENYIKSIDEQLINAYEIIDEYESTYLKGAELKLASMTDQSGYNIYKNYQSSVSDLESAYIYGTAEDVKKARKAFEEANIEKNAFFDNDDNVKNFGYLFDSIDTSLIETKNRTQDAIDIFKEAKELAIIENSENQERIVNANTKAQKKYNKEQKKQLKYAKDLYKLNPDRIDIEATLLDNTYASGRYSDALNRLIKSMGWGINDTSTLVNALVQAGIVQGTATDATNNATNAYNSFSSSIDEAIANIAALNDIMAESYSGKGISTQNIDKFKQMFGDDAAYALERTANGYHINVQKLYELQKQQSALQRIDYATTLNQQYDALERLNQEYQIAIAKGASGSELAGFVEQRKAINDNIQKIQDKMMEYRAVSSAYQTWITNQSNNGDREMYENIYSGFDTIKDEFEHGFAGIKTRSWLDLILNDEGEADFDVWDASATELKKRYEQLSKDIAGTGGYSIKDFFIDDGNGKITSQGIWNFFTAIENKQKEVLKEGEKGFVNLKEGWFDFTENGDYKIADLLGMDVETVQAILRAAWEAGFEVNLDEPIYSLEKLQEKAYESKEALEELTGGELTVNLNPENIDEANDSIVQLQTYYDELQNSSAYEPKVKTQKLEHLSNLIEYLIEQKRVFAEEDLFSFQGIDTALNAATERIEYARQKIISANSVSNKQLVDQLGSIDIDTNDVNELWEAYLDISELKSSLNLNPEVDTEQIKYFDDLLQSILEKIGLINNTPVEGKNLTFSQYEKGLETINKINDFIQRAKDTGVGFEFNWEEDEEFMALVNWINGLSKEQKVQLGLDPDTNAEQILDLARNGLDLEIKTEKGAQQVQQELTPTQAQPLTREAITTETVNTYLNQQLNTVDLGKETRQAAIDQGKEYEESNPTAEFDADINNFTKKAFIVEKKENALDKASSTIIFKADNTDAINKANATSVAANALNGNTYTLKFKTDGLDDINNKLTKTINKVNSLDSGITSVNNRQISGFTRSTRADGTAHAYGTAFAKGSITSGSAYGSGNWGLNKAQTSLVGELGSEIVVRNGNWFTVGDSGAEFVRLQKGDIVFNHKQSEELLENGYVTSNSGRGHLVGFANGTAFSSGTTDGAIKPTKTSSSSGKGGGGGNGGGNNSTSKDAEKTKNTLDKVEILLSRIQRKIAKLDKTISNTYTTWSTRNKAIADDLKKVASEITAQGKAYTTYINKANSIDLSETWKKKIQNGEYSIQDIKNSDLWDKIQEYKTWYEKALACQDAIDDLKIKEGELYKQRFDNEQTYYEELIGNQQHVIDLNDAYIEKMEEAGKLASTVYLITQRSAITNDNKTGTLDRLKKEYAQLVKQRDNAVASGKISKSSEAWHEMTDAIREVCLSIEEAEKQVVELNNAILEVKTTRWEKEHDAISGVVNELEFLYDLINEEQTFDEQGMITSQGTMAYALLAQQYDTYIAEADRYQREMNEIQKELNKDPYNQNLVDKYKELKEAQQEAISNANNMKESMVDLTEKGIKKQIDYVKDLIDKYNDLLDSQKDQIDYAKKVADQQNEINKLEKQYRAIQNDTSEEGATKRQRLKDQIEEKKQALQDTQEDRRISETKDMLSDFEEKFEDFLENKLKDIEGIVREVINSTNANASNIKDSILQLAETNGYTVSDTLKNTLDNISGKLVSYFASGYDSKIVSNTSTIVEGVNAIIAYYNAAQANSNTLAKNEQMATKIRESGTHIQTYKDANGNTKTGYFRDDGTQATNYTGWAAKEGKTYRFNNGKLATSQWTTVDGKKYYLDKTGARVTGSKTINGKKYYFDSTGVMQTGWKTINKKKYYYGSDGVMYTGFRTINGKKYYFDTNGVLQLGKWQTVSKKKYYLSSKDGHAVTGKQTIDGVKYTFNSDGTYKKKGWKKGTPYVPKTDLAWTNEGNKAEAIIRKSDGAILTPLSKGDSVIPSNAMKNMYKALTDPEKYLRQYTTPDIKVVQTAGNNNQSSPTFNMQFIANGVQDASKFVNELMNNRKLEKWIQEVTLGQANGNNTYRKYSYAIR